MKSRRPTQQDVARLAGVSRATVSMVINGITGGRVPISEETRRRVLEAMEQLGYTPNPAAQILAGGRNHLIGVFTYEPFFPYEQDNFYYPFLLGIERQASREGYNLLLITRTHGNKEPSIYKDGVNQLGLPDGSILLGAKPNPRELLSLIREGIPFVYIGRRKIEGCEMDWVAPDYIMAGYDAVQHLVQLGHRKIGFHGLGLGWEPYEDKVTGGQRAAAEHQGVEVIELTERFSGLAHARWIAELQNLGVTAVVCDTLEGYETYHKLAREAGVEIPRDLSLIALTEAEAYRSFAVEPTSVRLNRPKVGEEAVKLLIWRLDNPDAPRRHVRVPTDFVVGDSTAAAPSA